MKEKILVKKKDPNKKAGHNNRRWKKTAVNDW